jgi:hypothetical protein
VKSVAVVNRADVQQSPSWVRRTYAQNARNHPGRRPAEHAHVLATDGTDSHGNLGPPSLSSAFAEEPPRRSTARWRRSTLWWASTARWPRGGALLAEAAANGATVKDRRARSVIVAVRLIRRSSGVRSLPHNEAEPSDTVAAGPLPGSGQ